MRVLVYEHMSATAPADASPHLMRQGEAMIRALLSDLRAGPGLDVVEMPAGKAAINADAAFDAAVMGVDAVWPIAPETGGCLEALSRRVLDAGRLLCNSLPEAVGIAASKWRTWQRLHAAGIPIIATCVDAAQVPADWTTVVMKPDDGAGCEDSFVLTGVRRDWPVPPGAVVYQPYVTGAPRSFAMLCSEHGCQFLCINAQRVDVRAGRLCFDGVDTAIGMGDESIRDLARRITAAMPGLRGFVGVDYIDTHDGPVIVDVNPRLTTAYVGMSARLGFNVASHALQACGACTEPAGSALA